MRLRCLQIAICICELLCMRAAAECCADDCRANGSTSKFGAVLVRCTREGRAVLCASVSPCKRGVAVLMWVDVQVNAVQEN